MSQILTILIYGRDATLTETRQWVLQHAEYQVLTALDLAEAGNILSSRHIDLFILCHSLTPRERESALSVAHRLRPNMKNLILTAELPDFSAFNRDSVLTAFADSQTLITTATQLIHHTP